MNCDWSDPDEIVVATTITRTIEIVLKLRGTYLRVSGTAQNSHTAAQQQFKVFVVLLWYLEEQAQKQKPVIIQVCRLGTHLHFSPAP